MTRPRVLFIEDEKELVVDLPLVLESKGFDVTGAPDVQEGLQLFLDLEFDVVLTDIAMSPSNEMDRKAVAYGRETGIEAVRRMRAAKATVPIVALTVIRDRDILARMKEAGIGWVLNKPQEIGQIAETLRRALRTYKRL
jgi:CheY-like chemotaxis protein